MNDGKQKVHGPDNNPRPWEVAGTRPHTDEERELLKTLPLVEVKDLPPPSFEPAYPGYLFREAS